MFVIGLVGCAQLLNGQTQSAKMIAKNTYIAACGGAVETWSECNKEAIKVCNGYYEMLSKNENSVGTVRELTFQCKK